MIGNIIFYAPFVFAFVLLMFAKKPLSTRHNRKESHYHRAFVNRGRAY